MSKRLKATARLTQVGAKVGSILHTLADSVHGATLNLHDRAFVAKRQALAAQELNILKAKADTQQRHLESVSRICAQYRDEINLAMQIYDEDIEHLNAETNAAYGKHHDALLAVRAEVAHYREQHNAFTYP